MINVKELIHDPDFCETFTLRHKTGVWVDGLFQTTATDTSVTGVVRPATGKELELLPEGDRMKDTKVFYTWEKVQVAEDENASDEFLWKGSRYKALQVKDWSSHGFYETMASYIGEVVEENEHHDTGGDQNSPAAAADSPGESAGDTHPGELSGGQQPISEKG